MASMAAAQGSPLVATYAATKAFDLVLAEGLWDELGAHGVDVLACRAGATRTPNYEASQPTGKVPLMEPDAGGAARARRARQAAERGARLHQPSRRRLHDPRFVAPRRDPLHGQDYPSAIRPIARRAHNFVQD